MRPSTLLLIAALALGACAPSVAVTEGPVPARPDRPRPTPAEPEAPDVAEPATPPAGDFTSAPDDWWLLGAAVADVAGTAVARTYHELLADRQPQQTVVVAILDGGVDIEHEDLDDNLWVNPDEVPRNDQDDDGNGYTDDVHGWNFIGGPNGRNVHRDTYEVTRLYARLSERFEGADPDTLSAAGQAEYQHYREVVAAYNARREEAQQMLGQIRQMDAAVDQITALLRSHLGVDTLTAERVAAMRSPRNDLRQARQIFLRLSAEDITPAMIDEERQRLEQLSEYGLNPEFNPRPIVGDDYADTSEHYYGNADVEGPDAEHGTHVAGIVAAERGNGMGVNGIASGTRIMAIRAVPDGDERDKDVANGIRYAVDNGADIINMSFGKPFSPQKEVVDAAVRYAEEHGVLLIHAAGNDGADLAVEPSFPNRLYANGDTARLWIEVGASSWRGADSLAAAFSNYGQSQVDVFAPGEAIVSTVPGNGYEANSGTSMAAPVVTGLAALLMAYFPELDAGAVKRIILESATRYADQLVAQPGEGDDEIAFGELSATGGIVNAYAAVRMAEEMTAAGEP